MCQKKEKRYKYTFRSLACLALRLFDFRFFSTTKKGAPATSLVIKKNRARYDTLKIHV